MYSALPQRYSYNKGISVSFVVNIIIFALILQTHGTLFANFSNSKKKTHSVSMKKYKIVHKPAEQSASSDEKQINKIEQIKPQEIIEKPKKLPVEKPKPVPIPEKLKPQPKEVKPLAKSEITQEKSSVAQEVIMKESTHEKSSEEDAEQGEDLEPASDASYFGLNNEPPLYPIISLQMGESGNVTIEYVVSKDGEIIFAQVVESSGHIRLDRVAVAEFKRWKFTPAKNLMGQPVDSKKKIITFSFDIQNHGIVIK